MSHACSNVKFCTFASAIHIIVAAVTGRPKRSTQAATSATWKAMSPDGRSGNQFGQAIVESMDPQVKLQPTRISRGKTIKPVTEIRDEHEFLTAFQAREDVDVKNGTVYLGGRELGREDEVVQHLRSTRKAFARECDPEPGRRAARYDSPHPYPEFYGF